MATNNNTQNDARALFAQLLSVTASLRETTLTADRREWYTALYSRFCQLLATAKAYTFGHYENNVIDNAADDFNEAQLFYMGATIAAPSLHYSYNN